MESSLPGQVQTNIVENIPESAEAERVLEKMISQGTRLVFSTSYGHFEPMLRVASRHPEIMFEQCGRNAPESSKNIATYFSKPYQPMYIAGVVAGRLTKKNSLGFIAAHPIPQVMQNVNAFTLGVHSVNAKAKVHVIWTNVWSDPAIEAEATKGLIDTGIDVIAMHIDSPVTVIQTAERNGIMSVGYHADLSRFAPHGWLTGQMWNWGPLYVKIAESAKNGTWKPGNSTFEMKDGYTKLAPFGKSVPLKVQQEALALSKDIKNGSLVVFKGPVHDRDGMERIARDKSPDVKALSTMNWFVSGVEGTLPEKK